MMARYRYGGLWCIVAAILLCAAVALAADTPANMKTLSVVGTGVVRGENISASRDEAIANSLAVAVSAMVTQMLPSQTVVGHFQALNESVFSQSDRFVQDFKVLTQSVHAKTYRVIADVTVNTALLQQALSDLGLMLGKKSFPRVLLVVAEKGVGEAGYRYWWDTSMGWQPGAAETAMAKVLAEKGFLLVNHGAAGQDAHLPLALTHEQALSLGRQMQAEVMVLARVTAQEAPNTMGSTVRSFSAATVAQVVNVKNGQQIAQSSQNAISAGSDAYFGSQDALAESGRLTGEDLAAQVAAIWQQGGAQLQMVQITVEGIGGNIAQFVKFRGALTTMSGVKSVQLMEMGGDTALLAVDYQGSARALADALIRKNFGSFGINIAEMTENTIQLQVMPR